MPPMRSDMLNPFRSVRPARRSRIRSRASSAPSRTSATSNGPSGSLLEDRRELVAVALPPGAPDSSG